ncbi:uncharacterized protein C8Q71DRAFT_556139 [Rhodofomes roseus]|uniref:F-box domain-containing protein n=1 Tax=Rhodofomes roseus TaxID=34475 RepID=A0ABQ8KI93_9APHY|nr:uncharacterized protein C8Q71DRAFT_556139 [Rhodofomes roseus]KAH9837678.1 hypothetical protein C8Q71DRAFT_556139 [Rhodofomes roseus]
MFPNTLLDSVLLVLPKNDRSQLQGRSLEQMREWTLMEARASQRRLANLHSVHNATLPVHRLPTETLIEIFRLAHAFSSSQKTKAHVWVIMTTAVCRYWRDIVVTSPVFWRNIDLSKAALEFVDLCLERSAGAGIKLFLTIPQDNNLSLLAPPLVQHHSRLAHLDIQWKTNNPNNAFARVCDTCLPALTSLTAKAKHILPLKFTQGYLPSLRHVDVSGVVLHWATLPLAQLTSLALADIRCPNDRGEPNAVSLADILDILEAFRSLEEFAFQQWEHIEGQEERWTVNLNRTVPLPRMRRFHVMGPTQVIAELMPHVSLPDSVQLFLNRHSRRTSHGAIRQDVPQQDDMTNLPVVKNVRHIIIRETEFRELDIYAVTELPARDFWDSQLRWLSEHAGLPSLGVHELPLVPSLYLRYGVRESSLRGLIAVIGTGFFPTAIQTLALYGNVEGVTTDSWAEMLAACPKLEHLEIVTGLHHDTCAFPHALSPTSSGTPCPQLRELVLGFDPRASADAHGRMMLDALRRVLRERARAEGGRRLLLLRLVFGPSPPQNPDGVSHTDIVARVAFARSPIAQYRIPDDMQEVTADLESLVDSMTVTVLQNRPFGYQYG